MGRFSTHDDKPGKKITELRIPIQYSNIHARDFKKYPQMKGPLFRLDVDYVHLRKTNLIRDSINGTFYAGGSFHTMVAFRFMQQLDNSAIIYDYFNSLALSAGYRRHFTFIGEAELICAADRVEERIPDDYPLK